MSCKSCVLVSGEIEKVCRYSLFRSCTNSWILWNIFSSHFPTEFFQTKVYLFAQTSNFVPSINTVSFDNSSASSNRFIIWQKRFSQASARKTVQKRAMVLWSGAFCPASSHIKLIALLQARSIFLEE